MRPLLLAGTPKTTAHATPLRSPWDGRTLGEVAQAGPA